MPDESLDLRPCCSEISTMAENKKNYMHQQQRLVRIGTCLRASSSGQDKNYNTTKGK